MSIAYEINFPPDISWFCTLHTTALWMTTLCGAMFIVNMTFDRFYSIIRPHKAASFNTVKRAKLTIVCIVIFSILYNIPHLFVTLNEGRQCYPFGKRLDTMVGQFYYWLSIIINFVLPFVVLLIMNSIIIHTLRKRIVPNYRQGQGQGKDEGQTSKMKSSEKQIFAILLLVTFTFMILSTPPYTFFLFYTFYDYLQSPKSFAVFHMSYHIIQKMYFTNFGINFFLYVLSGKKFRTDLMKLFKFKRVRKPNVSQSNSSDINTIAISI